MTHEYRDRIYIRKDIIVKLTEAGELNQTKLLSYCGLNIVKHKEILDDMEAKGFIEKFSEDWGTKSVTKYRVTEKGRQATRAPSGSSAMLCWLRLRPGDGRW